MLAAFDQHALVIGGIEVISFLVKSIQLQQMPWAEHGSLEGVV